MTLHFIGLGLKDEKSITEEGLEKIRASDVLYMETYTSVLTNATKEDLEAFYGKEIISADRTIVEQQAEDTILKDAQEKTVAFLVIGDVFSATTHLDLLTRAKEAGIETTVTHNVSVLTAVGDAGLELYKYGKTTSIPFENEQVKTPFTVYEQNKEMGLHTLFLLDLRPEENRFMTCKEATEYLIKQGLNEDTEVVCCIQLGGTEQSLFSCKAKDIPDNTAAPQCLIIPGTLHFMEEDALKSISLPAQ